MKHVLSKLFLLTIILVLATCLVTQAATKQDGKMRADKNRIATTVSKALGYGRLDESHAWADGTEPSPPRMPIGVTSFGGGNVSPGVTVGYTYYDYQHNGSMGRMIDVGPHSGGTGFPIVHFSWMYLPGPVFKSRTYAYSAFRSVDANLVSPVLLHDPIKQYSGYVNIDVTADNRAVVGGHCDLMTGAQHYMAQMHFDGGPAYATFPSYIRVPDSLGAYDQLGNQEAMWPKFMLQFGTDTVLHVITKNWDYYGVHMYFRAVGFEGSQTWDYPPYLLDTSNTISHDLTGQRVGDRVALFWAAGPPYQEPWCDTCSGLNPYYDGYLVGQMDNDVYVQVSETQGVTWQPKQNLTKVGLGEAGYRTYCDLSALFDQSGYLHVVWSAQPWPADLCWDAGGFCFTEDFWIDPSRILHWSENVPYVRPICDHTYIPSDSCGPPHFWNTTVGKMSVSECDGKLYCMWGQFNNVPGGVVDDCAQWSYDDYHWAGGANADLWVSVSSDGGMTWDRQRNLTNSYTPHCDPQGGENCQSDYWPSMNRWGRQVQPGENWSGAVIVDPSGGTYAGNYYLDIQYVNDLDAGGIAFGDEGTWTNNPIKWFRMACVDPVPAPVVVFSWESLGDPCYVKPGEWKDTTLMLENIGNTPLTYTIDIIQDNGPAGWLGVSGFSGAIPAGLAGTEHGTVILNAGGIITTTGNYFGRLHFEGNDNFNLPKDIEIELIIADTLIEPKWDFVTATLPTSGSVSLTVSNHGNMGHDGRGKDNMDFYPEDCDTTATVYMYDGSPLVGWIDGTDTVFNYSIWSQSYIMPYGLRPQGGEFETRLCGPINAEVYQSGTFTTHDSTIAMERIYVAPQGVGSFMIEYLRVWSYDGAAHGGLVLGEAIDWDIPTDYLPSDTALANSAVNRGGIDATRNLVYCKGYEAYGAGSDTTYPYNCQYNDRRFGGSAFVASYLNGANRATYPSGGYALENDQVQATYGFEHSPLWEQMMVTGFSTTDSTEDLHTVFTYEKNFTLGADDVYEVVSVIATIKNGTLSDLQNTIDAAKAWYTAKGGREIFADDNGDGQIDVCFGCCAVMGKFYQDGLPFSIIDVDNFTEWLLRNAGVPDIYDCLEEVDVSSSTAGVPDGIVNIIDLDYQIGYLLRYEYTTLGECP